MKIYEECTSLNPNDANIYIKWGESLMKYELMKENNLENVLVTGGGIIPENDSKELSQIGVGKLFGPGTPVKESLKYIEDWVKKNRR